MKKILFPVIMFSFTWALPGCNDDQRTELDELELMRNSWAQLKLTDYEYEAGYNCYCGFNGPFILRFSDNTLDTVYIPGQDDSEIDYNNILERSEDLVIESLFQRIEENIKRNPHSFYVEYDRDYFFPKESLLQL